VLALAQKFEKDPAGGGVFFIRGENSGYSKIINYSLASSNAELDWL
jgi:hypothetical protein